MPADRLACQDRTTEDSETAMRWDSSMSQAKVPAVCKEVTKLASKIIQDAAASTHLPTVVAAVMGLPRPRAQRGLGRAGPERIR